MLVLGSSSCLAARLVHSWVDVCRGSHYECSESMLEYVDPSEQRGVMLDVQLQAVSCKSLPRITIPVIVCIRIRLCVRVW